MHGTVIITGGDPPPRAVLAVLPSPAFVIAADSGYDHARTLGLPVDLLVGDLDSISPEGLAHATAAGIAIERHRPDKDATDTELALDLALAASIEARGGPAPVHLVSGGGDRADHQLATVFAAASPRLAALTITVWWGLARIDVLRGGSSLVVPASGSASSSPRTFSVLPVHGDAEGVDITGAAYPLVDAHLPAGTSRGVSNVVVPGAQATVRLRSGTALVIVPDSLEVAP